MNNFKKLTLILMGFLTAIIALLIFIPNYGYYNDYYYNTPDEFLNSESFSWYIDIFPKSSSNLFLRTFVETNEMIVIFETNTADEIPLSQLYPITSKGIDYLKDFNIPTSRKQSFLDNGKLYCYFYSNNSPYLVSKYYSKNLDLVHYMFTSLQSEEALELCPSNTVKTHKINPEL